MCSSVFPEVVNVLISLTLNLFETYFSSASINQNVAHKKENRVCEVHILWFHCSDKVRIFEILISHSLSTLVYCYSQPKVKKDLLTSKFPHPLLPFSFKALQPGSTSTLHQDRFNQLSMSPNTSSPPYYWSQQHLTSLALSSFPCLLFLSLSFFLSEFPAGLSSLMWWFSIRVPLGW